MPKGDKLPIKQLLFIKYYLIDKNATQAYIKAGYNGKWAESSASKLLTNPKIKAIIDKELQDRMDKLNVSADRVIQELKDIIAKCTQKEKVKKTLGIKKTLAEDWSEVSTIEEVEVYWEFDPSGANSALEKIGKHLKMFTDKFEHTGKDGWPIEVVDFSNMTAKQIQEHLKSLM